MSRREDEVFLADPLQGILDPWYDFVYPPLCFILVSERLEKNVSRG
jgi:hypothetical protein